MSVLTRSTFTVDGVPLDVPGVRYVARSQRLHGPQNISFASVALPGRDGELPLPATRVRGATEWVLSMWITAPTYAQLIAAKEDLEQLLDGGLVTITEHFADGGTMSAEAILIGSDIGEVWNTREHGLDVTYTFRVPRGVWEGPVISADIPHAGEGIFAPGGSAPRYSNSITLHTSGPVSFELRPTGGGDAYIAYTDPDNAPGNIIDIDGRTGEALRRASPIPIRVSNYVDVGSRHFYIPADGRVSIVRMTGVTSATITTRKAYY